MEFIGGSIMITWLTYWGNKSTEDVSDHGLSFMTLLFILTWAQFPNSERDNLSDKRLKINKNRMWVRDFAWNVSKLLIRKLNRKLNWNRKWMEIEHWKKQMRRHYVCTICLCSAQSHFITIIMKWPIISSVFPLNLMENLC